MALGVDRDPRELAELLSEDSRAVKWMIETAIQEARKAKRKIGF